MSAITAIGALRAPPPPLPGVSQIGVGLSRGHPKSSQIGADFSDQASIGVGFSGVGFSPAKKLMAKSQWLSAGFQ
jgi:hypothetical protein